MRWEELDREPCSLARSLSIVGDRWTLLVLRECCLRVRRFEEFEQRLGIARHVLADRLKKLTDAGVLTKVPYQERPRREEYRLTEKGLDLYPVMLSLLDWGDKWMSGAEGPPVIRRHKACGQVVHAVHTCSECGEPLDARPMTVELGPGAKGAERPSETAEGSSAK